MKKTKLVIIIATVLTASLLLGAGKNPKQWEYAKLSFGRHTRWSWKAPGISAEATDVKELCKKLSIEMPPHETDVFIVVDWAGSKGWELAEVTRDEGYGYAVGWFKRPK